MSKTKLLTGLAIGGIIAYLYATESGAETRRKIADKTKELVDDFMDHCMSILQDSKETMEDIKDTTLAKAGDVGGKLQ